MNIILNKIINKLKSFTNDNLSLEDLKEIKNNLIEQWKRANLYVKWGIL